MDDLIRRQDAIDAVNVSNINRGIIDALQSILEELPSAQRWIPCSERLPDNPNGHSYYSYEGEDIAADEYIVMIEDAKIPTSLYWADGIWFSPYGIDAGTKYNVIAWMPLPESWEVEE